METPPRERLGQERRCCPNKKALKNSSSSRRSQRAQATLSVCLPRNKKLWNKIPEQSNVRQNRPGPPVVLASSSSIQTVTVGFGVSPNHALRLVGFTTGRDLHPALKIAV
jgi:hypothetical protein